MQNSVVVRQVLFVSPFNRSNTVCTELIGNGALCSQIKGRSRKLSMIWDLSVRGGLGARDTG